MKKKNCYAKVTPSSFVRSEFGNVENVEKQTLHIYKETRLKRCVVKESAENDISQEKMDV